MAALGGGPGAPMTDVGETTFQPDPRCRPSYPKKAGSCHFFLARKSRYCNITAIEGSLWCGNHLPADDGSKSPQQQRVPCPVDPSHTIYRHALKSHVRVCTRSKENAREAAQPYFRFDVNAGEPSSSTALDGGCLPPQQPVEVGDAPALFARVKTLARDRQALLFPGEHGDAVQQLTTGPVAATIMALIAAHGWADGRGRHVIQQASLVSHLHGRGLLDGQTTAVELGAGRGSLGLAVQLAFPSAPLVLVERSGVKLKADKIMRREGSDFRRLRLDLRHLYMSGLGLPEDGRRLAFVGKHVCGVATDFSLRAVATYLRERSERGAAAGTVGLAIACCCYHVCSWNDYVGAAVWEEELGLGRAEFDLLRRCACWVSSCYGEQRRHGGQQEETGPGLKEQPPAEEPAVDDDNAGGEATAEACGLGRGLSLEEKLEVGLACKRLIDYGRLVYLQRAGGLECELVTYCEPAVSPENTCILARSPAKGGAQADGD